MSIEVAASFDVETTGTEALKGDSIFSYCIGWPVTIRGSVVDCNVEVRRLDNKDNRINKANWKYLQDFFLNTEIPKIAHNFKFELHFLKRHNIEVPEDTIWHDTMIQSQLLRNLAPSHALDFLCWELCGYSRDLDKSVKEGFRALGSYQKIHKELMNEYQTADGERPILLHYTFFPKIKSDDTLLEQYKLEIETVKATQLEESHGLRISARSINDLIKFCEEQLERVFVNSKDIVGRYVNLNSTKQVREVLYNQFNFPVLSFTSGESPLPSVDKATIQDLKTMIDHPILDLLSRQRSYSKALAVLQSYLELSKDGVLYVNLNTNAARTGRKTSSRPNMQNVNNSVMENNPYTVPIRKCIIPKIKTVLIPVDYAGIEMRLIIAVTEEPELYDMLLKDAWSDMHHPTLECFLMNGIFSDKCDDIFMSGIEAAEHLKNTDKTDYKSKRKIYKNTGFCVAYGGGINKVSMILNKPVNEILNGDTNYRNRFSRIANFTKDTISEVKENGYVKTLQGRKLYVPKDKPYIGANYKIQGTAAIILKKAQVRLTKILTKKYKNRIKILLDVHDEIIFEYPRNLLRYKDEILPELFIAMIDAPDIPVPLRVEASICSSSWAEKKPLNVKYD